MAPKARKAPVSKVKKTEAVVEKVFVAGKPEDADIAQVKATAEPVPKVHVKLVVASEPAPEQVASSEHPIPESVHNQQPVYTPSPYGYPYQYGYPQADPDQDYYLQYYAHQSMSSLAPGMSYEQRRSQNQMSAYFDTRKYPTTAAPAVPQKDAKVTKKDLERFRQRKEEKKRKKNEWLFE